MQKRKSGCLKTFIFTILAVVLLFVISSGIENQKFNKWYEDFKDCPLPSQSTLLKSDHSSGKINSGNSQTQDYGLYWVIKTDLTKEEILAYYNPYIEEANKNIDNKNENKNVVFIEKIYDTPYYYHFDSLKTFTQEDESIPENVYIVYIFKLGRNFLIN